MVVIIGHSVGGRSRAVGRIKFLKILGYLGGWSFTLSEVIVLAVVFFLFIRLLYG